MMDFLDGALNAIQELRHAETPGTFIKQRMAVNANQIGNLATIQLSVEIANESLCKLVTVLYQTVDRVPVNVDSKTYRLLIPAPWGDGGYRVWGLRAVEARALRSVLMTRAHSDPQTALFDYGDRVWFLNVSTYKTPTVALAYLQSQPITAREWLRAARVFREQDARRQNQNRTQNKR